MPKSRYRGALDALYQTQPFQRLKRSVDGADGKMIKYLHDYFKNEISHALWGNNYPRYERYVKGQEAKRALSE